MKFQIQIQFQPIRFKYLITVFPATTSDTFSHTCRFSRSTPLHRTHVTSHVPFCFNQTKSSLFLPSSSSSISISSPIPIPLPPQASFLFLFFLIYLLPLLSSLCVPSYFFVRFFAGFFNALLFPDFDAFYCGFRDFLSLTTFFFRIMCGSIFDQLLDFDSGLEILSGIFSYV